MGSTSVVTEERVKLRNWLFCFQDQKFLEHAVFQPDGLGVSLKKFSAMLSLGNIPGLMAFTDDGRG